VIGPRLERLERHLEGLAVRFVLLTPTSEVVRRRDAGRKKHVFDKWGHLDEVMRDETPRRGLWLDTSDLTTEETVEAILTRAGKALL
jgi:hypothetical protein